MLKPEIIHGASYGEFWPDGSGKTSLEVPELHFRVSSDGRSVGQDLTSGHAFYRRPGLGQIDLGPTAGVSIAAFHPTNGEVYVSTSAGVRVFSISGESLRLIPGYIGSQGIRYIQPDGSVVSGDATYGSEFVAEYTQIGDVLIGQGYAGGIIAVVQGRPRVVYPGDHRFVRVNQSANGVAIYSTNFQDGFKFLTTMEELRSLPEVLTGPPAPTTPPVPPVIIEVPPVPTVQNQLSTVEQIRAKYPTPLGVRHPEFLVEVALATGGKLLRKDTGTHVTLASGENVSQDLVIYGSTGVDILEDGEGIAKPVWGVKEEIFDISRLVSVSAGPVVTPVPIPGLPGPEVNMAQVSQAISEALAPLDERLNVIGLKVTEVAAQLEALLKAPAKAVKVSTSKAWGHSHSIEFVV